MLPGINDIEYNKKQSLVKLSSSVMTDQGSFALNGPVSMYEQNRVCLGRAYSSVSDIEYFHLYIPLEDIYVEFVAGFDTRPQPGVLTFDRQNPEETMVNRFDVFSNAESFVSTVGSNTLSPDNVELVITESSAEVLSGTFTFSGQDNQNYSGEFYIELAN